MNTRCLALLCITCACMLNACGPSQPGFPQFDLPEPTQTAGALIFKDIPYTSTRKLDIYQPSTNGSHPLVIIFHGGGVNKEQMKALSHALAELGAFVVTPTYYSLPPRPPEYPILKGLEEAACAVRFARQAAAQLGEDINALVLIGHSAGGFAGADLALAGDDFHGDCLVQDGSALPDVFIGLDGAYDIVNCCIDAEHLALAPREEWDLLTPYTYVDRKPVREGLEFHLVAGKEKELAAMAAEFETMLQAAGYPVTMSIVPGVEHDVMAYPGTSKVMQIIVQVVQSYTQSK